jgi:hypothetical protein
MSFLKVQNGKDLVLTVSKSPAKKTSLVLRFTFSLKGSLTSF